MRRLAILLCLALAALLGPAAASVAAAPVWNLELHHNPTHFEPGKTAQYWVDLDNLGANPTSNQIELTVQLPAGITYKQMVVGNEAEFRGYWIWAGAAAELVWSCTGTTTVACHTTSGWVPRHTLAHLILEVNVPAGLPEGTLEATATLAGGGAAEASVDSEPTEVSAVRAGFGVQGPSFQPGFFAADGLTPERTADGRPALLTVPIDFDSAPAPVSGRPFLTRESGSVRDIESALPPGFLGAPTAIGECSPAQFTLGNCPPDSQVGRFDGAIYPPATSLVYNFSTGIFNMSHQRGTLTDLAFQLKGNPVHIRAFLDPSDDYAIFTRLAAINESFPPFSGKVTIWGVPADPSHDSERCAAFSTFTSSGPTSTSCGAEHPVVPFVTMPSDCEGEGAFTFGGYDSWQEPGVFPGPTLSRALAPMQDCEGVPFAPSVSVAPTTDAADVPSGLDVKIELPPHEGCAPISPAPPEEDPQYGCETATSPLRDATVSLPQGLTVNPAGANGLAACTEGEISLGTDDPVRCPDGSKVASVKVTTPALPDPVPGTVYLASPYENPFGTLLAGYIVLEEADRGLLVKIPGHIDVDPATGQLTGTFDENPQLPFSKLEIHFKAGAHSTLITPPDCGSYTTHADLTPWSGGAARHPASSFAIRRAPSGGCPTAAQRPNSPAFDAGAVSPLAGRYSPFTLDLSREDGSQRFSSLTLSPPPGLTAKLAGTAQCSEAALAAAAAKTGHEEQVQPSCPADSRIGSVYAAAGAGPAPYWAPGAAYLAGPYKGAPLSMAIVTPAVAGPFDLGTVVVRTALYLDLETARITAVSDSLPTSLKGIPLDIRRARVYLDRPDFTLNGTSCDPLSATGSLLSTAGLSAPLFRRFQLGECGRLGFQPHLKLRLNGATRRSGHPALKAVVTYPKNGAYANIARAQVGLPHSEFLDQGNLDKVCTQPQLRSATCPPGSIYGHAKAWTPLLDKPLEGPVYLGVGYGHELPDLVADLNGQVRILLHGKVDTTKHAGLRNTFEVVPDAPVSRFVLEMKGGKKYGLLVNSENICSRTQRASAMFAAQNGLLEQLHPKIANGCGAKKKTKKHGHHRGRGGRR